VGSQDKVTEKHMRLLLTTGLALTLAACGGSEEAANNKAAPKPTPTHGPMLGGVDLDKPIRVAGGGTSWSIYLAPGAITYSDASKATPVDFYPVAPKVAGGSARFVTQTPQSEPVTITLTAKACGAAEESLPLTAEVQIGGRTLKGCAGPDAYEWAERNKAAFEAAQRKKAEKAK
jgi:uncharacterized membrane protein